MGKYRVDGVADSTIEVPATTDDGVEVVGRTPVIVVDLTALELGGRMIYFEPIPDEEARTAAFKKYARGKVLNVNMTLEPEPEAPPAEEPAAQQPAPEPTA